MSSHSAIQSTVVFSKALALTDSDYSDDSDLFSDIRIYQTDVSVRICQKTIF